VYDTVAFGSVADVVAVVPVITTLPEGSAISKEISLG
jgi:hypothetical protein